MSNKMLRPFIVILCYLWVLIRLLSSTAIFVYILVLGYIIYSNIVILLRFIIYLSV